MISAPQRAAEGRGGLTVAKILQIASMGFKSPSKTKAAGYPG
jgi:hypothetical protein